MLGHVRVVDLTCDLGSYAGALLAEMGAEVTAYAPCSIVDPAEREMALRGKRLAAEGADVAAALDEADIVLRGPETDPAVRIEDARAANPRLIEVAVLPFYAAGDNAARPAADISLIARSGLATIVGDPDRAPLNMPGRQAWALAGIQGAIAALVALNARASTGVGDSITVSAYQSAVLANYREPLTWEWAGRVGNRTGNLLVRGKSGVRQIWPCADGYVTWALVDNPPMMRATIAQMQKDDAAGVLLDVDWDAILVADMPRETLETWEALVEQWFAGKTRSELSRLSNAYGMGLSAISATEDVLADPHLAARGLWRATEIEGQAVKVPGPLFRTTVS